MTDAAYRSSSPKVLLRWTEFRMARKEVVDKRAALSESVGRGLMVNRATFGHATRVVGFERFFSDESGTTLLDGSLRVLKSEPLTVVPNHRTKRGKDMAAQLNALTEPDPDLPGMPNFHLGSVEEAPGLRTMAPALWSDSHYIYALWPTAGTGVDHEFWDSIPLSVYYTAQENFDG